jgi:hypothetical protein
MPPVEFEPTISEGEGPQTYALDRAATGNVLSLSVSVSLSLSLCIYSYIQDDQKVSVPLMITVQKTRKSILNNFNHLP